MIIYFVVNEHAGNGRGKSVWKKLENKLDFTYIVYKTTYPKHAIAIVNDIRLRQTERCLIVAVGGDGTLNEVISGAAGSEQLIISVLKAGSGNDFARGYNVFNSVAELNQYIKQNKLSASKMDIGRVMSVNREANFVNNTGFGYDALVATTVNNSKIKEILNKVGLGRLAYVLLTIKLLFTYKRFDAEVVIDGQPYSFKDVWFIAVCNQPYFGGGMKISPHSKMNDECLEVVVVQQLTSIKLLFMFLSVFVGKHEKIKGISFYITQHVQMKFNRQLVSHVDGDLFEQIVPNTEIKVSVDKKKWLLAK